MKQIFKKWILVLYAPSIFFRFTPVHMTLFLEPFLTIAFYILTFMSLSIVSKEWNSNEKTLPEIQIIIGLAPFISMIVYNALNDEFYLMFLSLFLPFVIIPTLIFVTSGMKGLPNNKKSANKKTK